MRIMENLIEKVIRLEKEAQIASKAADDEKLRRKAEIEENTEAAKKELYAQMDKKISDIREREEKILEEKTAETEKHTEETKKRLNELYEKYHEKWEDELFASLFE